MDLHDLEVFLQVAQDHSFSRAAAALHMAQPSVSSRIAALETELDTPLFIRGHRGVTLTEAGQALLPYARRCLQLVAEGREAARGAHGRRRVNIAAPPSMAASLFKPVLLALADAPIEIHCYTGHSWEVKQMLLDGVVQAGFILASSVQSGIHLEPLHQDPIICVAASDHPLAGRTLNLADLAAENLVPFNWGPEADELLGLLEAQRNAQARLHMVQPAIVTRDLMLEYGYISFLPRLTMAGDLGAGVLVELKIEDLPVWTWDVAIAYRERKTPDPALESVLEVIRSLPWHERSTTWRQT